MTTRTYLVFCQVEFKPAQELPEEDQHLQFGQLMYGHTPKEVNKGGGHINDEPEDCLGGLASWGNGKRSCMMQGAQIFSSPSV